MKIEIVKGGQAPQRMTAGAVGFDVFTRSVELDRGVATIHLGFKIDTNDEYGNAWAALLVPRSGWGSKYGFALRNTIGVIDSDYRGELIMVANYDVCPPELVDFVLSECNGCEHDGCGIAEDCQPKPQPRVGQMLIVPCYTGELEQVERLGDTMRGAGGFGSTGNI